MNDDFGITEQGGCQDHEKQGKEGGLYLVVLQNVRTAWNPDSRIATAAARNRAPAIPERSIIYHLKNDNVGGFFI